VALCLCARRRLSRASSGLGRLLDAHCSLSLAASGAWLYTLLEAHAPAGGEWMAVAEEEDDPTGSIRTPETGPCRVDAQVTRQTRSALYETRIVRSFMQLENLWKPLQRHCFSLQ
jgi:hypothetical protein